MKDLKEYLKDHSEENPSGTQTPQTIQTEETVGELTSEIQQELILTTF
jgi:hypothetical protein